MDLCHCLSTYHTYIHLTLSMVQDLFKSEGKRPNVIEINTTGELCIREAPELVHAIQNSRKCKERRQ